jgi:hypothetical protein
MDDQAEGLGPRPVSDLTRVCPGENSLFSVGLSFPIIKRLNDLSLIL